MHPHVFSPALGLKRRWDFAYSGPLEHVRGVLGPFDDSVSSNALEPWQESTGMALWPHLQQQMGLLSADGVLYARTAGVVGNCYSGAKSQLAALHASDGSHFWQFQSDAVDASREVIRRSLHLQMSDTLLSLEP